VTPGTTAAWAVAIRPASLPLAIGPVLVGASIGYFRMGVISVKLASLALLGALLMQVLTNLQNDIGFTERGCEKVGHRIGLPRATANGWLTLGSVRIAIILLSLVSVALGCALFWARGWPILAIGTASLLAALAYMGGPKPIAYTPFGELTVFVFFGLVAVMGTDWLLTGDVSLAAALAAACIGCLSAAALTVNNHRDIEHDRLLGRRTFAALWGPRRSAQLLAVLLGLPFLLCGALSWICAAPLFLAPLTLLGVAGRLYRDFVACAPGMAYNAILGRVFRLELWFAGLLAIAAILQKSYSWQTLTH
jgi:1,4-dihydroxy-2-naphthoate octaprenyltransferase